MTLQYVSINLQKYTSYLDVVYDVCIEQRYIGSTDSFTIGLLTKTFHGTKKYIFIKVFVSSKTKTCMSKNVISFMVEVLKEDIHCASKNKI